MTRLIRYYSDKEVPEESIYQTVLCNAPGLRLCNGNKRYADWRLGGTIPHPTHLGLEDLPKMLESGHHFARKFSMHGTGGRVLDELDRMHARGS